MLGGSIALIGSVVHHRLALGHTCSEARKGQHLGTDTKPASMRIAAPQRRVRVSNQAYANLAYVFFVPFGEPQWTAADLQSPQGSAVAMG